MNNHQESFRVGVCESPDGMQPGDHRWNALTERVRCTGAGAFLLNEMPFGTWVASGPERDEEMLAASHRVHNAGVLRLSELGTENVIGSRPTFEDGASVNQGFVWTLDSGLTAVHSKQFFPNEPGYYEASWYERGETHFRIAAAGPLRVGFLICTEVMFNEWARHYGRHGANLIVVPRATPMSTTERWRTAVRMAAVVSGCYVASSNRSGEHQAGLEFGGAGWIVNPAGDVIAESNPDEPVVSAELDLALVANAKRDDPCYVEDLPNPLDPKRLPQ